MNFLPQTTIQPVSGSQAAKAPAEPMTRRDLPDLTQSSDAPRAGRSETNFTGAACGRQGRVTEEAQLVCDGSAGAGTAERFRGKNEDS